MKSKLLAILFILLFSSFCASLSESTKASRTEPKTGTTATEEGIYQEGIASWYGPDFHGKRTANGEVYDQFKLTAAHKELPFHTMVEVKDLDTGKKVVVRINDRGPFVKGRIIDLSKKAAQRLDMVDNGTTAVSLRIVKAADVEKAAPGSDSTETTTPTVATPPQPETKTFEKEEIHEAEIDDNNTSEPTQPVVQQEPVKTPPPQTPPPTMEGKFYLQAGAFSSYKNAGRMVSHIKDVVPEIPFSVKYIDGFYKAVSAKNYLTREEAEKDRKTLQNSGFEILLKESK